jgi:LmbE family N-acetylglucosaminyl deacetylase
VNVTWVVFAASPARAVEARASAADYLETASASNVIVNSFKESYFPHVATEIKDFFEELKGLTRPDLILSHRRADRHQDHRVIAELAWNTFRDHLILEYEIPKYEGDLGHPNLYVPLTEAIASRKVELLRKHFASQWGRAWFKEDTFHGLMSLRAIECNAPEGRAEAFQASKLVL